MKLFGNYLWTIASYFKLSQTISKLYETIWNYFVTIWNYLKLFETIWNYLALMLTLICNILLNQRSKPISVIAQLPWQQLFSLTFNYLRGTRDPGRGLGSWHPSKYVNVYSMLPVNNTNQYMFKSTLMFI